MSRKQKDILQDLFLREKPAKILMGLRGSKNPVYATLLSKDADCTYSHTIKILNAFKALGIVDFEKTGRIKTVTLTTDGAEIAGNLEVMAKKFIQLEQNMDAKPKESVNKSSKKRKR
jgi:predicted transcriptional regulator